jgi:hypothetical protein
VFDDSIPNTGKEKTFMRIRTLCSVVVLVVLLTGALIPASAQDGGLSDEELALLDRVFAARENLKNYSSYVEEATFLEEQNFLVKLGEESREFNNQYFVQRTATILQGDTNNISATIFAQIQEDDVSYSIDAEARVVDETLYFNGTYLIPDPDLPLLPEGWTVVVDPDVVEGLENLHLDDMIEDDSLGGTLFDEPDLMRAAASLVTVMPSTLDDGTPVDIIAITLDSAGVAMALTESSVLEGDSAASSTAAALTDESELVLLVALDAENNPHQVVLTSTIEAIDVDGPSFDPSFPEGLTFDTSLAVVQTHTYSQFNEPFEPVAAPEALAQ